MLLLDNIVNDPICQINGYIIYVLMIYEAEVTFHLLKALVFVPGETGIVEGETYKMLISPNRDQLIFINHPATPICRIYLAPCRVTIIESTLCKLTHYEMRQNKHQHQIVVLTIKSTQPCINNIKQLCPPRKHKSCLSLTPSAVRHISILSGESPTQKYRGFINLIFIMFVVLNLRNMVDNFFRYGARFTNHPLQFLPYTATLGFISLFIFIQIAHRLDRLRFHRILSDIAVRIMLKVNQIALLVYVGLYCNQYLGENPLSGISFTAMGIVLFLKLVSYMQVNTQILSLLDRSAALARAEFSQYVFANHQISPQNLQIILKNRKDWQPLLSRYRLFYFLIAPTLCYQLDYPRSPPARKSWLIKRIVECIIITALQLVLWVQYMEPQLASWFSLNEQQRSSWLQVTYRLLRLSIPNTICWVMGFYNVFHLLLNIISEIIQFGDRNFYMDWWNCRNLQEYWKTWNLPVHFFFVRHCYTPLLKRGWSKLAANFFVFIVSALAHEYLVCVPLGVVSYYAFLAMLMQAPAMFAQKLLSKALNLQNSELGNVSFWLFFCFLGQPIMLFIYYSLYMQTHG